MLRKVVLSALLVIVSLSISAQQKYFVDGFHGGVYGHYPLMTYTEFLVNQMNQHPNWYLGFEIEPETWDTVMVKTPEAYRAMQLKMATDQVEYTNPSYAQSYLYCTTGESIIRQFTYGIKKVREHFPNVLIKTYSVEEPCFTSCLPTILPKLGIKYAVLKCPNTCWGGYGTAFGGELINLIGPDGTSLLSVPRYEVEDLEPKSVWQTIAWGNNDNYFKACFDYGIKNPVGMTYQDAGWTNGPWIGTSQRRLRGTKYTRWTKYIEEQSTGSTSETHRYSQEDVCPGLMWGSQVLQRIAQQCRVSEYLIPQAEKMSAMAQMANGFSLNQKDIDEAWRLLLLSQHHDCWIVPYNHLNNRGNWADNVKCWTDNSNQLAQNTIEQAILSYKEEGKPAVKIFNTSGFPRTEVVAASLADGRYMNIMVDVPAFGYTIIPTDELTEAKDTKTIKLSPKECIMENDLYRIVFDLKNGGVVKSLKLKDSGYDYVDKSKKDFAFGELRGFFYKDKQFHSSKETIADVTILQDNQLVKSIEISGEIAGTTFHKTVTLRKGSPIIDCCLNIDWKHNQRIGDFTRPEKKAKGDKRTTFYDTRYALSLMYPTSMKSTKLYKNAPFDVCESQLDNTFFNDWDSIKHNVVVEWIDLESTSDSHSLSLFTDHTTSYSYGKDYPLALTAQYSGPGLWGRDYKITHPTTFHYAIVPHVGKWDEALISQLSTAWNEPLVVTNGYSDRKTNQSLINIEGSGYEITNITCEDNNLFLRLFNASSDASKHTVHLTADVEKLSEVDFLGSEENTLDLLKSTDETAFNVEMPRFAVRTYKLQIRKQ